MVEAPIYFCAVRGMPAPRRMCLKAYVGSDEKLRKRCGHDGPCEHKQPAQPAAQAERERGE